MDKKLIAIAVAGALAAPLTANAEVTVSGQIQQEVVNWSGDGASLEGLVVDDGGEYGKGTGSGNASEVAVTAAEDLGGGLKALAKWSTNFSVDETNGNVTTRDAYAGISGGFGTVLVGSMSTPYKASTAGWDPFVATFAQARGNGGMSALHNGYANNVIAYANKFGPAKVVAAVSVDETDDETAGETDGDHATTFSVNVPVGPVEVAVAYFDSGADEESTAIKAGARYVGGPLAVAFQYETLDQNVGNGDYVYLNAAYTMGSTTVSAGFGQYSVDDETAVLPDPVPGTLANFTTDATYMTLGVKQALSKSTGVYAAYRLTDPDTDADSDETAIGVGLRVKF